MLAHESAEPRTVSFAPYHAFRSVRTGRSIHHAPPCLYDSIYALHSKCVQGDPVSQHSRTDCHDARCDRKYVVQIPSRSIVAHPPSIVMIHDQRTVMSALGVLYGTLVVPQILLLSTIILKAPKGSSSNPNLLVGRRRAREGDTTRFARLDSFKILMDKLQTFATILNRSFTSIISLWVSGVNHSPWIFWRVCALILASQVLMFCPCVPDEGSHRSDLLNATCNTFSRHGKGDNQAAKAKLELLCGTETTILYALQTETMPEPLQICLEEICLPFMDIYKPILDTLANSRRLPKGQPRPNIRFAHTPGGIATFPREVQDLVKAGERQCTHSALLEVLDKVLQAPHVWPDHDCAVDQFLIFDRPRRI